MPDKNQIASTALNVLGLACGAVMVTIGILRLLSFSPVSVILGIYYVVFGIMGAAVEYAHVDLPVNTPCAKCAAALPLLIPPWPPLNSRRITANVRLTRWFPFMEFYTGKGLFYLFWGLLLPFNVSIPNIVFLAFLLAGALFFMLSHFCVQSGTHLCGNVDMAV